MNSEREYIYRHALEFMYDNLSCRLCIEDIAKECGVCPTLLKSIFSEKSGHGVARHFLGLRLEKAKSLLVSSKTITEVSDALGFSSQAYFSQCFKRECGCTPGEYRKSVRRENMN